METDASWAIFAAAGTAFVLQLAIGVLLLVWGRRVARRARGTFFRVAAWIPAVAILMAIAGPVIVASRIVGSFGSVASADPAERATVLAQSISEAMNFGVLFVALAGGLYLASFAVYSIGTLRLPAR